MHTEEHILPIGERPPSRSRYLSSRVVATQMLERAPYELVVDPAGVERLAVDPLDEGPLAGRQLVEGGVVADGCELLVGDARLAGPR